MKLINIYRLKRENKIYNKMINKLFIMIRFKNKKKIHSHNFKNNKKMLKFNLKIIKMNKICNY